MNAISQAWMDGHPLRVYRHAHNTIPRKGWAGGDSCMRAVQLALLTRSGQPGAPTVLSAPCWGFYDCVFQSKAFQLPRPFGTWVVENTLFKLVAAEAHALSAIEAALILWRKFQEQAVELERDILTIKVRTHAAARLIIDKSGQLNNAADRDHCMQYMLAVTLLKGAQPEYCDYSNSSPWATDGRVSTLRRKIEIVEDEQFTRDYCCQEKRSLANAVTVKLNAGNRTEEVSVEYPLGSPNHSGTAEAVRAKIHKNLSISFEVGTVEQIVRAVFSEDQTPVDKFVDTLWKGW